MPNNYTVVCYATEYTPYISILGEKLKPSLKKFELKSKLKVVENQGNWYKNTAYKPKFILDCLNELDTDIVWIDADAIIVKYPELFNTITEDIAFHRLSWNSWYGYKDKKDVKELLTGTMYFRNKPIIKDLCKKWYEESIKTNEWEQKVLQRVIKSYDVSVYELPVEYVWMDTFPNGGKPIVEGDPVIIHYQASREWKRKIPILDILNRRKK